MRSAVRWLRLPDLIDKQKRGRTSIYRAVENGELPPPVKLAENTIAWAEHEIAAIDRARLAGVTSAEGIRKVVAKLVAKRGNAAVRTPTIVK